MNENSETNNKAKGIISKIVSVISTVILILSILAAGFSFFTKTQNGLTYIGKYSVVRILTESMRPVIEPGDYILIERVDPSQLKEGDVITFVSSDQSILGSLNTHRIVSINGETITTKGDFNVLADKETVSFGDVRGRYVCSLDFVTAIGNIFAQPIGYVVFIAIPMMFILSSYMNDFMKEVKTGKQEIAAISEEERIKRALEEMKASGELDERIKKSNDLDNLEGGQ